MPMPEYIFTCSDCGAEFSEYCSMFEIEALKPACRNADCYSLNVYRNFKAERKHGNGGTKTLGSLADKNTSKMSSDERHHLTEQHFAYLNKRPTERESYENDKTRH